MSLFPRKNKIEQIGLELSDQLKKVIANIPDALSSVPTINDVFPNVDHAGLEGIDKSKIEKELAILIYVGQRLAVQLCEQKKGGNRTEDERREILSIYDSYALEYLDKSPEFRKLINPRGERYFQLVQSHLDEFHRGKLEQFLKRLSFEFEQFCRGGGGQNDPIIIGAWFALLPMSYLSCRYWSESFMWTFEYLIKNE